MHTLAILSAVWLSASLAFTPHSEFRIGGIDSILKDGTETEYVEYETETEVPTEPETESVIKEVELASPYEIELLALVTMAEAEGEPEEGKRLVIDTILNRVDSPHFPNTIEGVIYQEGQFSSMWDGRINICYVKEDICQLVREELQSRSNYDVMFFRTGYYSKYGTPMFQVGHHYFASYN